MTQATPSTAHATHPTADRRTPTPPAAASPHAGTLTLAARGVAAEYPGRPPVLTCADIDLTRGARLALLGANGSGKTTLLRVLAGAHRPSGGRVELPGSGHGATEVLRYDRRALRHHRSRVQLVLQDPDDQLFSADVRQDVSFGPLNQGLPETEVRARVVEALRLLGIEHLADRPTHHLSYGERKRVATAGAVAMRPEVLLLEEPAAGLDPAGVAELLSALDRLEHAGTTIALATHDVELALAWADEVAVVIGGRVVQGPAVQLLGDEDLLARARLRRPWPLALAAGLGLATRPRTLAEVITALSAPNPTAGAPTPTASAPTPTASAPTEAQPCEVSR